MRAAYGKNVGTAAWVKPGQPIMSIETSEPFIEHAKSALRKAGMKIPSPCTVNVNVAS